MALPSRSLKILLGLTLLVSAGIPRQTVRADTAPKPTMEFVFQYGTATALTIVSGIQEECSAADCSDARPLMEAGPQRFGCSADECSSLAYSYSDFHRLNITFSDGVTRQSNIFGKRFFYARYLVAVRGNDLIVAEQVGGIEPLSSLFWFSFFGGVALLAGYPLSAVFLFILSIRAGPFRESRFLYVLSWIVSLPLLIFLILMMSGVLFGLLVELTLAALYAFWRRRSRSMILTVAYLMNLLTMPLFLVFFGGHLFPARSGILWIAGTEAFVWLVESGFLALALRKQARLWEAALLAFVLNAFSFGLGLLLPF